MARKKKKVEEEIAAVETVETVEAEEVVEEEAETTITEEAAIAEPELTEEEVEEKVEEVKTELEAEITTKVSAEIASTNVIVEGKSKVLRIVDLFNYIARKEKVKFKNNEIYNQKTEIYITGHDGKDTKVLGFMTKKSQTYVVSFDSGKALIAADKHILKIGDETIFVDELTPGTLVNTTTGTRKVVKVKPYKVLTVYDLQVENEEHLYSDASGLVHHNTYDVTKTIKAAGLVEGKDWYLVKGTASAMGVFQQLFEARHGKLTVFDDCDSVLKDEKGLNIFKVALDSDKNRKVSWKSDANVLFKVKPDMMVLDKKLGVMVPDETNEDWQNHVFEEGKFPDQYMFDGAAIFISNLNLDNPHIQAIKSRSAMIDINLTAEDLVMRIESIHESGGFEELISDYGIDKKAIDKTLENYKKRMEEDPEDVSGNLNIRGFTNSLLVFAAGDEIKDHDELIRLYFGQV
jgi:hypothetical protein